MPPADSLNPPANHSRHAPGNDPDSLLVLTTEDSSEVKAIRKPSKIQFPYFDLDEAINIARLMHDTGGNAQSAKNQLAAVLVIH